MVTFVIYDLPAIPSPPLRVSCMPHAPPTPLQVLNMVISYKSIDDCFYPQNLFWRPLLSVIKYKQFIFYVHLFILLIYQAMFPTITYHL